MTKSIVSLSCIFVVSATLAGCGPAPDGGQPLIDEQAGSEDGIALADDDAIHELERDLGGPEGVMAFFETSTEDEIRALLANYGMTYSIEPRLITDCPKYFPSGDRNEWHNFDGEHYYIDGSGRPRTAWKNLPPIAAAARNTTCQGNVGQWGDAEVPSNDYDGGHMIGSQLGGWGSRANLVPQDANFNSGNWLVLENKMARCAALPSGRIEYYISVGYSNSTKLVPSSFGMTLTNRSSGASVSLSFTNTDGGGSNGPSEKNRGVTFLTNQGCN